MSDARLLVFDIEADALALHDVTTVHCLHIEDFKTGEKFAFGGPDCPPVEDGVKMLEAAHRISAHNGIDYDGPVLKKLYNAALPPMIDTVILSRLLYPDRFTHPAGGSRLKDWGKFLADKGLISRGKDEAPVDWTQWSQEMHDYCSQDVSVGVAILKYLMPKAKKFKKAVKYEHEFACLIAEQVSNGIGFDLNKAEKFHQKLITLRSHYYDKLQDAFPPIIEEMKTPQWYAVPNPDNPKVGVKRENKTAAIRDGAKKYGITQKQAREIVVAGPPKTKEHPFNPGSNDQIAARLSERYGWRPKDLTPTGKPMINEKILSKMEYPEAQLMLKFQLIEKRLEQVTAWLSHVAPDGRIHGGVNTIGTVTLRCSHSNPNLGQVPAVRTRFGRQCRKLFGPGDLGEVQIGSDASGLELRCLANRLWEWDGGEYANHLLNGDIHTVNMEAGGLKTRDQSKTAFYAFLYGSGDANLGRTIAFHESLTQKQKDSYGSMSMTAIGKQYRDNMMRNLQALGKLQQYLTMRVQKYGYIESLHGAHIPIRSPHMALNTQLQCDGAVISKVAMILMAPKVKALGGGFMAHVHDEWQCFGPRKNADKIGAAMVEGMRLAGEELGVKIPIDGEYKIGNNWRDCH